jgi:hypothetical protein
MQKTEVREIKNRGPRIEKQSLAAIPKVRRLLEVYTELPTASAKNDLLKDVIEKIVYTKTEKGSRWHENRTDRFKIVLYPRLPKD